MSAPEKNYRERVLHALRTRCVFLKTKAAYLGLPDAGDVENEFDTAIWWCDRTGEPLGADGRGVDVDTCAMTGRRCYEGPRVPGEARA